jgi:hypothetical protein
MPRRIQEGPLKRQPQERYTSGLSPTPPYVTVHGNDIADSCLLLITYYVPDTELDPQHTFIR